MPRGEPSAALADLRRSGLTKPEVRRLKIRFLEPAETKKLSGQDFASYLIPYHDAAGADTGFYRLRHVGEGPFGAKSELRYWQRPNTTPQLYLAPVLNWVRVQADPAITLVITEGEKKAAVGCLRGATVVGLGGVWSWRSKKSGVTLLPALEAFAWDGRTVVICFDSDAANRSDLLAALYALSNKLEALGAIVLRVDLPKLPEQDKTGLDDFLLLRTIADFTALPRKQQPVTAVLHALNDRYAILRRPAGEVFSFEAREPILMDKFLVMTAPEKLQGFDARGKPADLHAGREWVGWRRRRMLDEIVYEPDVALVKPGQHNLWTGWGVEPRKGSTVLWDELMVNIFGGDALALDWFLKWCAYPVQHPGAKLYTAVVLWGGQGVGKSLTGETLIRIYGEDNVSRIGNDLLHSSFNGWAARRQFILADEVSSTERRADANRLKDLVTRPRITVNEKFKPHYTLDDHANFFLTSNQADPLLMDDDDRRFFVHRVAGGRLPDAWTKRYDRWFRDEGASALMHRLISDVDTSEFRPKAPAMETVAKREAIDSQKSDLELFVERVVAGYDDVFRLGDVVTPCDLQTPRSLLAAYERQAGGHRASGFSESTVARLLSRHRDAVAKLGQVRTKDGPLRLYAFRNVKKWREAGPLTIAEHYNNAAPVPRGGEVIDIATRRKF